MGTEPKATVRVTYRFAAPAERVFDAWLDAANVGKWLFATPTGQMVRVEIDGRVGGRYAIVDRRDGEDVAHEGEYLEIDRPHRLVMTLCVPKYAQDIDNLTVEITPLETGCQLTLTHEMDPQWAGHAESVTKGWTEVLTGWPRFCADIGNAVPCGGERHFHCYRTRIR